MISECIAFALLYALLYVLIQMLEFIPDISLMLLIYMP